MCKQTMLEALRQEISKSNLLLSDTATNLVFGKGSPNARIMLIGEAPGKFEDLNGVPFVGRAGKILDDVLASNGLSLNDIYIANILKYRPPDNRDPNIQEIRQHTPYLIRQIEIIRPKVIATLGNYATRFVLSNFSPDNMPKIPGISFLHGKLKEIQVKDFSLKVVPMYHPAATIYNQKLVDIFSKDFTLIKSL